MNIIQHNPHIHSQFDSQTGTWSHLLIDPQSAQAALVDPVWGYDPVSGCVDNTLAGEWLQHVQGQGLELRWILETHAHADHVSAADYLRGRSGASIAVGQGIRQVAKTMSRVFGLDAEPGLQAFDRLLADGDALPLGNAEIRVLFTPGHTPDSVTFLYRNAALVGDTLFAPERGTARCDFPGGSAGQLFDSIQAIYALTNDTELYLCHDYPDEGKEPQARVTLQHMRQENVHIRENTAKADFVRMREQRDATLGLPGLILPAVQMNIRAGRPPEPESNGVGYIRIPFDRALKSLL